MPKAPPSPSRIPRRGASRRISIAVVLTGTLAGLVVFSIGIVLAVGFFANAENTFSLMNKRAILQLQAMQDLLTRDLDRAAQTLDGIALTLQRSGIAIEEGEFTALLRGALVANPRVGAFIAYRDPDHGLGVARTEQGGYRVFAAENVESPRKRRRIAERFGKEKGEWGDIVLANGALYANYSRSVRRSGGAVMLVAVVSLERIAEVAAEVADRFGGTTYILDGANRLLAHSALPRNDTGPWRDRVSIPLDEVPDPVMRQFERRRPLSHRFGEAAAKGIIVAQLDTQGEQGSGYLTLSRQLAGYGPRPWQIGVYYPGDEVGQEVRRLMISGAVGLLVLILAVLLAIWLGRKLAAPVLHIAEQSERLARLEVDDIDPLPRSRLLEFDEEARAFNAMVSALRAFTTYVPRSLVTQLMSAEHADPTISREAELTVMFTDIAGFTTISETLSAAETARLLNAHLALLCREIAASSGTIDKFMGDGLMAFWGAPEPLADHARRAAGASLAIADALRRENAAARSAGRIPLRVRIGLHTGPVIVGNIGAYDRVNYTIIGDTVNVTARLQTLGKEIAPHDEVAILVSAATTALLGDDFITEPVGEHHLRGRDSPIVVHRLIARKTTCADTAEESA